MAKLTGIDAVMLIRYRTGVTGETARTCTWSRYPPTSRWARSARCAALP